MEEDYTDEELREITRRKREDVKLGRWGPEKVKDVVGDILKEEYEAGKRAREKARQYAKRRKAREERERQRKARGRGKGRNRRELPKGKFTPITNEFIEGVYKQYLRPYESKVLWFLVRKTWGWGKKSDFISLRQFEKELGIPKDKVCKALSRLKKRGIVAQLGNKTYAIQTDTSLWRDKPKKKRVRKRVENS